MRMKRIAGPMFRRTAQKGIHHVAKPNIETSDPMLRALYAQLSEEFQTVPPMTLHASAPELLAGCWHASREVYVVGRAERAKREAVAAVISELNSCPYCETVHAGMFAAAGGRGLETAHPGDLRAVRDWAAATLSPGSAALCDPGIPPADIPQIFGTAVMFHYTNRMVSLFLEDSPLPLPGMTSPLGVRLAKHAVAIAGRRMTARAVRPGGAVVQRTADLPEAFAWARSAPDIAAGLAHFALAAEEAGAESVPGPVREIVQDHLSGWSGGPPPLSRMWLEALIDPLDPCLQPIARLALLAARAPWQVDDAAVAAFRRIAPDDRSLVQTTGWAAFAAARRVASWFPPAPASVGSAGDAG